jgi:periplasmic protein TonB
MRRQFGLCLKSVMPDNNNPAHPVGRQKTVSTTDEVLRLLGAQQRALDDELNNPELEQLLGTLSKGFEEGLPESALGVEAPGLLTLEELAGVAAPPRSPAKTRAAPSVREPVKACAKCGYGNPLTARFCGMCGQGLAAGSDVPDVPKDGASPRIATEPPKLVQLGGRTGASEWVKAVLLGALILALVLVVYQQQLWRLPLLGNWISNSLSAPAAPVLQATPPAQPNPASNPAPASVQAPLPAAHPPGTTKPTKPTLPHPRPRAEVSPGEAALIAGSSAAPTSRVVNRESPVLAPAISTARSASELPSILNAPGTFPALMSTRTPAPAHESASPPKTRGSQVTPGELIFSVNPEYPPAARNARVQGSVIMHAVIGTDGSVQQLRLISGNPLLVRAAMAAVRLWRYRPYLLDGKPIEGETDITVNFKGE